MKDLRAACAHYGLDTKGKKATLQATLVAHFDEVREQTDTEVKNEDAKNASLAENMLA